MAHNITDAFKLEYELGFERELQQTESLLHKIVNQVSFSGLSKEFKFSEDTEMEALTERLGDTVGDDPQIRLRSLFSNPFKKVSYVDQYDDLGLSESGSRTSAIMTEHVSALNRRVDKTIIEALNATAKTGRHGGTDLAFPAGQVIANGSTNISLDKILEAHEKLTESFAADMNDLVLLVGPSQQRVLLGTDKILSKDFNDSKAFESGMVPAFYGFNVIVSNLLPVSGGVRNCFAFSRKALYFAKPSQTVDIDRRPDKYNATQIMTQAHLGAMRSHDEAVVQIDCDES